MPYTMEDFRRDNARELLKEMSPEEIVKVLSPEEILKHLPRAEIEAHLKRRGNGPSSLPG